MDDVWRGQKEGSVAIVPENAASLIAASVPTSIRLPTFPITTNALGNIGSA